MKYIFLLILFTSCISEEGKIRKRQKQIRKETIQQILDYKKKHPRPATSAEKINKDELFTFTGKIASLKKERDSLQKVLAQIEKQP